MKRAGPLAEPSLGRELLVQLAARAVLEDEVAVLVVAEVAVHAQDVKVAEVGRRRLGLDGEQRMDGMGISRAVAVRRSLDGTCPWTATTRCRRRRACPGGTGGGRRRRGRVAGWRSRAVPGCRQAPDRVGADVRRPGGRPSAREDVSPRTDGVMATVRGADKAQRNQAEMLGRALPRPKLLPRAYQGQTYSH